MSAGVRKLGARMPRIRPLWIGVLAVVVALLAGAWLWFRDSSLVAVRRVNVTVQNGPDSGRIRAALIAAARTMTTLDVRLDALRNAVAPYPVVKDLRVSTQFPHAIRIRVIEQVPVAEITVGARPIAVAGDGTLLHDTIPSTGLPLIPLRVPPGGDRLTDRDSLNAVALLAAAPYQLLARVTQVTTVSSHGLVAQLRDGPSMYFGDATRLDAKWTAASEVIADSGSVGASYVDVTDPERPAAGASPTASAAAAPGAAAAATTTSGSAAGATGGPVTGG